MKHRARSRPEAVKVRCPDCSRDVSARLDERAAAYRLPLHMRLDDSAVCSTGWAPRPLEAQ